MTGASPRSALLVREASPQFFLFAPRLSVCRFTRVDELDKPRAHAERSAAGTVSPCTGLGSVALVEQPCRAAGLYPLASAAFEASMLDQITVAISDPGCELVPPTDQHVVG